MPRIKTFTAQTSPGVLQARTVSPDSYGAQAGAGITELGRGYDAFDRKMQHNKDQLDLTGLMQQYEVQLDEAKNTIANHPDIDRHGEMLRDTTEKLQENIFKQNLDISSAVQAAFQNHAIKLNTTAAIDLAHQGRAIAVERQVVDLTQRGEKLVDTQAYVPPGGTFSNDTSAVPGQVRATTEHLLQSFTANGTIHPAMAEKLRDQWNDRFWSQRATLYPMETMQAIHSGKTGFDDFDMDPAKAAHYTAIAVNTLNQRQADQHREEKEQEKRVKDAQEAYADTVLADLIGGKTPAIPIETLLRGRKLNSPDAERLFNFQVTRTKTPNVMNYNPSVAAATEAALTVHRYDNTPANTEMWRTITDDYNAGLISEPEHTRLMGLYRDVVNYKNQAGNEPRNAAITRAHSSLMTRLEAANKLTGYSAIGNQTQANAEEFFYRYIEENPKANPWEVMHKAETTFKPLVEKSQGLSKTEEMLLDDAKVHANAQRGIMSKAAVSQDDRGRKIVSDAIKALPPPPGPSWYDRFFKKSEERKPAGVMGE